ncbi:DUF6053 domain-containing protein [Lysobacter enzymogenes]|uniref:DUF6053 domain-containing protein n=1 Tax=Lysobacter enzymogenes TaxID=69 RepID=UPI003D189B7C
MRSATRSTPARASSPKFGVGGPSGPMPSGPIAAIWPEGIGPEGPPTRASPAPIVPKPCPNPDAARRSRTIGADRGRCTAPAT